MVRDDEQDMAGRDGQRGGGRFLVNGGEEPPSALDRVILRAAREALREEPARDRRRRLLWPLAASLLLSTTAVLLVGPDAPQRESATLLTEEAQRPQPLDAPRILEIAPPGAREESAATGRRIQQQAPDGAIREGVPATALEEMAVVGTPVGRSQQDTQPAQETAPAEEQEIIVTGSRIRLTEPVARASAPADFSEDPGLWRTAIQLLLEAGLVELARQEREQFLLRYPELDPGPWPDPAMEASQEP